MTAETPQAQPPDPPAQDAGGTASPAVEHGDTAAQQPAAPVAEAVGAADMPDGSPAAGSAQAPETGECGEGAQGGGGDEDQHKPRPRVIETRPEGAPKKRRRRKRKPGGSAHAEGGAPSTDAPAGPNEAGDAPEGAEGHAPRTAHAKPKGPRPPRPDRERPAFTVGDIVFGKVTEITDEAIFVDLSGKGRGIFDRAELLLPLEEEEEASNDAAKEADDGTDGPGATEEASAGSTTAETPLAPDAVEGDGPAAVAAEAGPSTELPAVEAPSATEVPPAVEPPPAAEAAASPPEPEPNVESPVATPEPAPAEPKAHKDPQVPRVILEVGAPFVGMVHNDGGRGGLIVLTHHPKRITKAKALAAAAFKDKTLVSGLVTGVIKGGVEVDVDGLRAFAPGSHMDLHLGADLSPQVGKRLPFQVTQYAKRGRDVVLSRRSTLETEAKAARDAALQRLQVGAVVEGTVRSVVPFGAFIDIGDIEGLVPLAEMSHNRTDGPSDVFKAGEKVPVKIIKLDDRGKVWLSRKATIPDPWGEVAKKYATGTKHTGRVVRLQPFGAFVELEPGVDGLIHTADLSTKRIEHPSEIVKVDEAIDVVVAHLDAGAHRIGLHPALTGDAAGEQPQRVQQYKMVKAKVVAIDPGGLVVRILGVTGRNGRAFITAAATGTPRGTDLRKHFPIGQVVEAKVMEMDPKRGEVKLSIKSLNEQHERDAYQQYRQQLNREARFTFGDLLKKNQQQK